MLIVRLAMFSTVCYLIACNMNFGQNSPLDRNKVFNDSSISKDSVQYKLNTDFERKKLIFKKWAIDTLRILAVQNTISHNMPMYKTNEVILKPDSLGLSVNYVYHLPYAEVTKIHEKEVEILTELLKEYKENPKAKSILAFRAEYFFNPSPVSELPYDMTFDLEDVKVISEAGKGETRYSIVRGRITKKRVFNINKKGDKTIRDTVFTWQNKKIIKQSE